MHPKVDGRGHSHWLKCLQNGVDGLILSSNVEQSATKVAHPLLLR